MSVPNGSDHTSPRVVRDAAVDWVKADASVARNGSIDPVDKALYIALASFADAKSRSTDPDPEGKDIPTRPVLAGCIGKSVDTVDRATRRLEKLGLVRVERRKDPDNPKSHLPSVYHLLDHEWWDERAAARAAARAEAREAERAAQEEARGKALQEEREAAPQEPENDPEGWPHGCGQGGRTDAARVAARMRPGWPHRCGGSSSSQEDLSLSEGESDERERETAASPDERASAIGAEWTIGTGIPRVPSAERKITEQAAELLAEGHDPSHLAAVARWMARKGWRDLGYALTAPGAPAAKSAPSKVERPNDLPDYVRQRQALDRENEAAKALDAIAGGLAEFKAARAAKGM